MNIHTVKRRAPKNEGQEQTDLRRRLDQAQPGTFHSMINPAQTSGSQAIIRRQTEEEKYVSPDLVCSYWADLGLYREIGDARTHDDVLDDRAGHHRIHPRRRRYPDVFAPVQPAISSRWSHFFHAGRDPGPLYLL